MIDIYGDRRRKRLEWVEEWFHERGRFERRKEGGRKIEREKKLKIEEIFGG